MLKTTSLAVYLFGCLFVIKVTKKIVTQEKNEK